MTPRTTGDGRRRSRRDGTTSVDLLDGKILERARGPFRRRPLGPPGFGWWPHGQRPLWFALTTWGRPLMTESSPGSCHWGRELMASGYSRPRSFGCGSGAGQQLGTLRRAPSPAGQPQHIRANRVIGGRLIYRPGSGLTPRLLRRVTWRESRRGSRCGRSAASPAIGASQAPLPPSCTPTSHPPA